MARKMNFAAVYLSVCLVVSIMVSIEIFNSLKITKLVTMHRETSQQQPHTRTRTGSDARLKEGKLKVFQEKPTPTRPFPKWGSSVTEEQEIGIPFPPLLSFIQTSSPYIQISEYYRSTLDHSKESKTIHPLYPETLYMIQPSIGDGGTQTGNASVPPPPVLYGSVWHRRQHGPAAPTEVWQELELTKKHKLNQTERVMLHALQILHQEVTASIANRQQNDNVCQESRWPFLCQNLYPSLTSSNKNEQATVNVGGFPFLAYYGDYKGCNYHNWQQLANGDNTELISRENLRTNATKNVSLPLFTVAAQSKDCNYTVPFPNFYQISYNVDDVTWDKQELPEYTWSQKLSKIVWRGSLTGAIDDNVTKCPRWKMVESMYQIEKRRRELHHQNISKATSAATRNIGDVNESTSLPSLDYQEIFDAKITAVQYTEKIYQSQLEHDIGDQPIVKSRLALPQMQWYRGIIDIDGHSWSGRFGSLLCMNSVVMKVDPSWVEYFYARRRSNDDDNDDELQAWKHYIPIRADFSNLEEMTEYVLDPANDEVLQEIVRKANTWCRQNMVISRIMTDMLDVWDRYVELLNINNDRWLEQHWNDHVQTSILENRNLIMEELDISNYHPLTKGQ